MTVDKNEKEIFYTSLVNCSFYKRTVLFFLINLLRGFLKTQEHHHRRINIVELNELLIGFTFHTSQRTDCLGVALNYKKV